MPITIFAQSEKIVKFDWQEWVNMLEQDMLRHEINESDSTDNTHLKSINYQQHLLKFLDIESFFHVEESNYDDDNNFNWYLFGK